MVSRWQRILARIALMIMVGLLVAACGGASTSEGTTEGTSTESPASSPFETGEAAGSTEGHAEGEAAGMSGHLAASGKQVFADLGCEHCHSIAGAQGAGPALNGVFGTEVPLADGTTVTADEAYLRESITDPDAKIVEGFSSGIMAPAVSGMMGQINEGNNLDALVAYIKSLK